MLTHTYTLGSTWRSVSTAALPTRPPGDASWPRRRCFKEQREQRDAKKRGGNAGVIERRSSAWLYSWRR